MYIKGAKMRYIVMGLIILFSGCSFKDYKMFNNEDAAYISHAQDINMSFDSKIMPDDVLSIDIYNMNQKTNILKGSTLFGTTSDTGENQYIVSSDGTIYLPLLQEINVQGFTIRELNKKLTLEYKKYLKQPYVKISLKNHKVYVFGEVKKQGVVPMEGSRISIIEVLAKSGGLSDYAISSRVHVIGEEGGKYKIRTLDMSRLSTLTLNNMMLKNNSIVYVEPRGVKLVNTTIREYLPLLQVISSLASTYLAVDYVTNGQN